MWKTLELSKYRRKYGTEGPPLTRIFWLKKKLRYAKFLLVGIDCRGLLLLMQKNPHLPIHKPKIAFVGSMQMKTA